MKEMVFKFLMVAKKRQGNKGIFFGRRTQVNIMTTPKVEWI